MRTNNTIRIIDTLFLCVLSLSVHAADYPVPAPPAPAQWPLEFSVDAPGQPTVIEKLLFSDGRITMRYSGSRWNQAYFYWGTDQLQRHLYARLV